MSSIKIEPASAEKTMELLWSRVRRRGDLPGFSKVISAIIQAMRGDDDREFSMTKTVLSDPALTQKVLRLANSPMYSVFGQGINTVSKAVMVLGTEAIGHLALGLKLIDGLSAASADSASARDEMEKAVLAGHIARQLASSASTRDAEEAVVCSILHSLGRMMVTFYLPERWQQLQAYCTENGASEEQAAHEVLGIGLDEIGRRAGQKWGFPPALIETLRDVPPASAGEPLGHGDWLTAVSTLSFKYAKALCAAEGPREEFDRLATEYADMLGLEASQILTAVEAAQHVAAEEDAVMVRTTTRAEREKHLPALGGKPADALAALQRGVADMRDALQDSSAAQVMAMALEIVHHGLGFSRTIAFLRDQTQAQYRARMYFGDGVQELLPRLVFSDAYQPDVFHAALANDKPIFVENAHDAAFLSKVPRWWKEVLPTARSFMVLPLVVNRQPAGFIYGDWDLSLPPARIESAEIAPLNELRGLIMQALERRRQMEPAWMRRMS
ncbi:HDOD domain-containing protein [Noviherbaspirillum massiliense]|uniref:HDOD domain-containing protein n=1 Tax=Noviherbaspirillum massiliense TaxID=1465823 RepID=UPI0003039B14|nr:HDOD domain-containing protein [Noviherbaspirillum massiliense]